MRRGSSPRMRGSQIVTDCIVTKPGIIPAHAGLTLSPGNQFEIRRDHPRACGAHPTLSGEDWLVPGSSPRMRGSHGYETNSFHVPGIIPAHAGLTRYHVSSGQYRGDHPRACGAHLHRTKQICTLWGSSPRMRGSRGAGDEEETLQGIIPAHAGLTLLQQVKLFVARDHPRACGAHGVIMRKVIILLGSSPRMRGSPGRRIAMTDYEGIIPAHAGLTPIWRRSDRKRRDHPRACGAHTKKSQY